jgi:hypothetical protein
MQESRYDHDRDGSCDDPACRGVPAVAILDSEWAAETGRFIRDDLREIGIELALVEVDPSIVTEAFDRYLFDPATRPALLFGMGWGSDYPSAGAWLAEQSRGGSDGNFALVGASDEDLAGWGYPARGVPSVDARVDRCQPLAGSAGVRCWAELEQYLHEEVVPWVPLAQEVRPTVYGQRVVSFASDLVTTDPAYERIAVRAE